MEKPVFDVAELDRLIEQEEAKHRAYKELEREVEQLRQQLKEREAELASKNPFPRWGMSKAAQYTNNYISGRLQQLSQSKGGSE